MWKPLASVTLVGKRVAESSKPSPSKVIQIEARPLPSVRSRSRPSAAVTTVAYDVACKDHDYCLPSNGAPTGEAGKRWNVKQQSFITIKPIKQPAETPSPAPPSAPETLVQSATKPVTATPSEPLDHRTDGMSRTSVLETPDASPTQQGNEAADKEHKRKGSFRRSYRWHEPSYSPSPRSSPKQRPGGRGRKRRAHRSPSSESSGSESDSSRSPSRSPSKKRFDSFVTCVFERLPL